MKKIFQILWGYLFMASVVEFLSFLIGLLCHTNHTILFLLIMSLFLLFCQILPLEYSDYPFGFRIELRNPDLH